jgi:tRNA modification GTPase
MNPNRAILLTPLGPAAIAVVRFAGPATAEFLRRHFSKEIKPGRCVHGTLTDGARVIDDPVVVALPNGGADVNVHGGPWVVRSVLELARRKGFDVHEPGEGSTPQEATDGDMPLEREIAAQLPLARTELGIRVLLAQASAWEGFLANKITNPSERSERIRQILEDMSLWHLLHPPTVAIVGAANVGKSTLANQLFGQERSITADLAGTTRDWVGEIANVDGLPVMLMDTPGIRATEDAIEQTAIARSRQQIEGSQLVVLVLDATAPLEPEQSRLLAAYPQAIRVVNKSDRPSILNASSLDAIHTVATTGKGVNELRRAIAKYFGCAEMDPGQPRWWTERQRMMLERGITTLAGC